MVKNSPAAAGDIRDGFDPWSGRSLGEGNGNPFQYSLPGESHGPRSLAACRPWGLNELDTTEQLSTEQIVGGISEMTKNDSILSI